MTNTTDQRDLSHRRPALGFLFQPFDWMTGWLTSVLESAPALLPDICSITCQRMHLMGLALAHLDSCPQPEMAHFLLRGRARDILDHALGRRPKGLKRALDNTFCEVLSQQGYRYLVELLDDPAAFKLLAHAPIISESNLEEIASIPVALRPLFAISPNTQLGGRLVDGLQYLVMRGAAPSYDALMDELKNLQQPQQLKAHVRKLIDSLPIPDGMPPPFIGPARRLDSSGEIRNLAKQWRNCLTDFLPRVNDGQCAIYLWEDLQVLLPAPWAGSAVWAGF